MNKTGKKQSSKNIILVVIIIFVIGGTVWYVFSSAPPPPAENISAEGTTVNKYSSSIKRLDNILKSLNPEFFSRDIFNQLKSFINLPLEIGRQGKENPFAAPPAPEDLLLNSSSLLKS